VRHNRGVAIDAQRELRQVIGANRKAIEDLRKGLGQDDVAIPDYS